MNINANSIIKIAKNAFGEHVYFTGVLHLSSRFSRILIITLHPCPINMCTWWRSVVMSYSTLIVVQRCSNEFNLVWTANIPPPTRTCHCVSHPPPQPINPRSHTEHLLWNLIHSRSVVYIISLCFGASRSLDKSDCRWRRVKKLLGNTNWISYIYWYVHVVQLHTHS
jgi:hypothetical protein